MSTAPAYSNWKTQRPTFVSSNANPINLILQMIRDSMTSNQEARQANEGRYNDILELFGVTRGRALDALKNFGESRTADLKYDYNNLRNDINAGFARHGMPGSTRNAVSQGVAANNYERSLSDLLDRLRQNYVNTDTAFTDKAAGVMERRTDPYTSSAGGGGDIGSLVAALAAAGGLGGGGGTKPKPAGNGVVRPTAYGGSGAKGPSLQQLRQMDSAKMAGKELANTKASLLAAYQNYGARGTRQDALDQAQLQAVASGQMDWNPAQTVAAAAINPAAGNNPAIEAAYRAQVPYGYGYGGQPQYVMAPQAHSTPIPVQQVQPTSYRTPVGAALHKVGSAVANQPGAIPSGGGFLGHLGALTNGLIAAYQNSSGNLGTDINNVLSGLMSAYKSNPYRLI